MKQIVLKHKIDAAPMADDFREINVEQPRRPEAGIVVKVKFISVDPYVGHQLNKGHMGALPPRPGIDMIPGGIVGQVIESNSVKAKKGDHIHAASAGGWAEYCALIDDQYTLVDPEAAPLSAYAGIRDITSCFETATMKPHDGALRLTIGSKFEGTDWFNFSDQACELEVYNVKTGRDSEKAELASPATWFGNHSILNDGFLAKFFPLGSKPGKRRIKNVMMSSPYHRGATGPELFPLSFGLAYVGDETVTVGAGTFENARKFEGVDTAEGLPEVHPPYIMWMTNDEDGLFLKGNVDGYMMPHYELVELSR